MGSTTQEGKGRGKAKEAPGGSKIYIEITGSLSATAQSVLSLMRASWKLVLSLMRAFISTQAINPIPLYDAPWFQPRCTAYSGAALAAESSASACSFLVLPQYSSATAPATVMCLHHAGTALYLAAFMILCGSILVEGTPLAEAARSDGQWGGGQHSAYTASLAFS